MNKKQLTSLRRDHRSIMVEVYVDHDNGCHPALLSPKPCPIGGTCEGCPHFAGYAAERVTRQNQAVEAFCRHK